MASWKNTFCAFPCPAALRPFLYCSLPCSLWVVARSTNIARVRNKPTRRQRMAGSMSRPMGGVATKLRKLCPAGSRSMYKKGQLTLRSERVVEDLCHSCQLRVFDKLLGRWLVRHEHRRVFQLLQRVEGCRISLILLELGPSPEKKNLTSDLLPNCLNSPPPSCLPSRRLPSASPCRLCKRRRTRRQTSASSGRP